MNITVDEFLLCAHAKGYEIIKGFEDWAEQVDFNGYKRSLFAKSLLQSGILEKSHDDEDSYVFSPLGQLYMEVMSNPTSWIKTQNRSTGSQRYIYAKNFYFLSVDIDNNQMNILLLPTIQLMVGAYACTWPELSSLEDKTECTESSWDDQKLIYELKGESFNGSLDISICDNGTTKKSTDAETEYSTFSEETYTNIVTKWFLKGLCIA